MVERPAQGTGKFPRRCAWSQIDICRPVLWRRMRRRGLAWQATARQSAAGAPSASSGPPPRSTLSSNVISTDARSAVPRGPADVHPDFPLSALGIQRAGPPSSLFNPASVVVAAGHIPQDHLSEYVPADRAARTPVARPQTRGLHPDKTFPRHGGPASPHFTSPHRLGALAFPTAKRPQALLSRFCKLPADPRLRHGALRDTLL